MAASLLRPDHLSSIQVLGNFLPRFDTRVVVLSCFIGGQVKHFAQWADMPGLTFALSWCRTADPAGFAQAWQPAGEPGAAPVETPSEALDLLPFTDETLLRHFMRQVGCRGALLAYLGEESRTQAFWRWRDKQGQVWAKRVWADWTARCYSCPLRAGVPVGPGSLSPATTAPLITWFSQQQHLESVRLGEELGWSPTYVAECSRL